MKHFNHSKFLGLSPMKVLVFLSLMFFEVSSVYSQKCSYEKNETDKFTSKKTVITDAANYANDLGATGYFKVIRKDDDYQIYAGVAFNTDTELPFKIESGQNLIILLDNKDTIMLSAIDLNVSLPGVKSPSAFNANNISAAVHNTYNVSKSQMDRLLASPIASVRIYFVTPTQEKRSIDKDVKKSKFKNVLINSITCAKSA